MNDIDELKQFVLVHAKAQNIPPAHYGELLGRIDNDDDGAPGSWAREWSRGAARLVGDGKLLEACRDYNMARFPYVDGPARQQALDGCVSTFGRWAAEQPDLERIDLDLPGGRVGCWATGLTDGPDGVRKPLLLVTGGIVSIKEQWAPVLLMARKLGLAGVVTEMPGVGENTLAYDRDSWRILSDVLDAVADRADVSRTYAVALSFSGHLALRCAVSDQRIRGIATAGVPVGAFFTDADWQSRLPRVTVDTLARLTGAKPENLYARMADWALTPDQLAALDIPVACTVSLRDEIIPPADPDLLRAHVRKLSLNTYDDVHGSPRHVTETRLWIIVSVLRMMGARTPQRALLEGLLAVIRLRRRLTGSRG
ncbi:alpha/beta hydrolase [Embleya sp. NPDC050154]|uniref:alpha/beta hydrolase n=1 Tax=Embleya sp. NPDC050154 TaxID=3363988 RepID=UPI0037A34206